jgi:hypothetical protein
MGIGYDQLDAAQAAPRQLARKRPPELLGLQGTDIEPQDLTPAIAVDTNREITATETMRPFWRTFM